MHPDLGCMVGVKYKRINIDLTITFKFLKSQNGYYAARVHSDSSVVFTDKFFGGYFGIEGGYDLWRKNGQELQLLGGIGLDGFDAINEDKNRGYKAESTWTYNFNFGIGHRYYLSNSLYLGLRGKYNVVNYASNNVVGFSGNPITVSFVVGGLSNKLKSEVLKTLHYKWRK
jgi:hypothetical protein